MFKNLDDMKDISNFIDVEYKDLKGVLFSKKNYFSFEVPKKNGDMRTISAPKEKLNKIQHNLLEKLNSVYKPRNCVNGFVKNKSILTNAKEHINNKYLLNLDLKDFFPTINFYRVRNLFMSKSFNASKKVASILANIVTYNGKLPQGACTSPLISNMICRRLDNRLYKFFYVNNACYTRYADDISISWNDDVKVEIFNYHNKSINPLIDTIIIDEGFTINQKKTKYSTNKSHKEVTGIIINDVINARKDYFFRLKSMINDALKNGIEDAYRHYCEKRNIEFKTENKNDFIDVLLGTFNFYEMIVNEGIESRDRYKRIALKLNKILGHGYCDIKFSRDELYNNACFLFEYKKDGGVLGTGTIFKMGKYFITCKHCLMDDEEFQRLKTFDNEIVSNILYSKYSYCYVNENGDEIELGKVYVSSKYDVALFYNPNYYEQVVFKASQEESKETDKIEIFGFPDYLNGDKKSRLSGHLTSERLFNSNDVGTEKIPFYTTDIAIITGNSGGPVINSKNEVIGIVEYGQDEQKHGLAKVNNGISKIKYVLEEIEHVENIKYFK